tara:strand:+ start:197 stop:412 length:216 start_codon:yes stop_codon:yes gene_type:complete
VNYTKYTLEYLSNDYPLQKGKIYTGTREDGSLRPEHIGYFSVFQKGKGFFTLPPEKFKVISSEWIGLDDPN